MGNKLLIRIMLVLILTSFCVLATACPQKSTVNPVTTSVSPDDTAAAAARQATVDALSSLSSGYALPKTDYNTPDSVRQEGWFDVNDYFSILTHLSMQPGYVLDYVYHNGGSAAQPYLYARKIDSKPFNTLEELTETYVDKTKDHTYDYLSYVQTDDTNESFFQYITLRIMGGQFYLWWHANYNDHTITCDYTSLKALFAKTASFLEQTVPLDIQKEAQRLDLAPSVKINKDTVTVRVVIFTKWGGFIEETYSITRTFPHITEDIKTKTLVPWQINITF